MSWLMNRLLLWVVDILDRKPLPVPPAKLGHGLLSVKAAQFTPHRKAAQRPTRTPHPRRRMPASPWKATITR
jgi:hypothetical protein